MRIIAVVFFSMLICFEAIHAQPTESDIQILQSACAKLPPGKIAICNEALRRMNAGQVPKQAQGPQSKQQGNAKELITLRGIGLDGPDVRGDLEEMCLTPSRSHYTAEELRKSQIWCRFNERGEISMPSFDYGNLKGVSMALVSKAGALIRFEAYGSKGEMLRLAEILEEKYGRPLVAEAQVANGIGTRFEKKTFLWMDAAGNSLSVETLHDKIDRGRILIESADYQKASAILDRARKDIAKERL